MGLLPSLRRWRRERLLRRHTLDAALWLRTVERYACTRDLSARDRERLMSLVVLFLHEKPIHGAGGLVMTEEIRVAIAAQACMLILELDLDYYRGWVEVIVYPDEFVARYDYADDYGIVHSVAEPMSGESWERGPVILSWADAAGEDGGDTPYNVVMHEFAHKLDMLNGAADGFPPLHKDMSRKDWNEAHTAAYENFCARIDARADLPIDEYAGESPAEFFAVMSEVFFERPQTLLDMYPLVYAQLARFYRQDPVGRATAPHRHVHLAVALR